MENVKHVEMPVYAKITGIFSLILAIVSFLVPIVGTLWIAPMAIILGVFAIYGENKKIGLAVIIIMAVKLIISPTFWVNFAADYWLNSVVNYINVIGMALMVYFYAKK